MSPKPARATEQDPRGTELQIGNSTLSDAIDTFTAAEMAEGFEIDQVEAMLVDRGFDSARATRLVNGLVIVRTQAARSAGKRDLLFGIWCCGAGFLALAMPFSGAVDGGGTYVVAGMAIAWGVVQFLRGLRLLDT